MVVELSEVFLLLLPALQPIQCLVSVDVVFGNSVPETPNVK